MLSTVDQWWPTTLTLCKSHFYTIWKYIIYLRQTTGKKGPEIVASNRAPQVSPWFGISLVLQAARTTLITTGDQVCWLTHFPWLGMKVTGAASVPARLHTSQQLGWHPTLSQGQTMELASHTFIWYPTPKELRYWFSLSLTLLPFALQEQKFTW